MVLDREGSYTRPVLGLVRCVRKDETEQTGRTSPIKMRICNLHFFAPIWMAQSVVHNFRRMSTADLKPREPGHILYKEGFFFVASAFRPVWPGRCDLSFICIPQSTRALDQGGVEPRQAVSPKALRPWTIPLRYSVGYILYKEGWHEWDGGGKQEEEAFAGHTLGCIRLMVTDNNIEPFHWQDWEPIEHFAAQGVIKDSIWTARMTRLGLKARIDIPVAGTFFFLRAPFGQYGPVAAFELYLYTAVDSRPGPGGSRTTASCQP